MNFDWKKYLQDIDMETILISFFIAIFIMILILYSPNVYSFFGVKYPWPSFIIFIKSKQELLRIFITLFSLVPLVLAVTMYFLYNSKHEPSFSTAYDNFSWKEYGQSFNWKKARNFTLAVLLILCVKDKLQHFLDSQLYGPYLFDMEEQTIFNLALVSLLLAAIVAISPKIYRGLLPGINTFIVSTLVGIVYLYYARLDTHYDFISFASWHMPWLKYTDVLLGSVWLFLLDFKAYKKQLYIETSALIEDAPVLKEKDEDHNFNGYAGIVVRHINNSSTREQSFAIGIFAQWGTGKSYFLRQLDAHFIALKDKTNVLVHFSAWRSNSPEVLVDDFFASLARAIEPYNSSIGRQLTKYSQQLFQTSDDWQFRLLDKLVSEVAGPTTILSRYEEINTAIKRTGKRFIVFIDDLDRLSGTEIISVFKIIRSTADFANTFFVVALDYQYTVDAIRKTEQFSKEEEYLKKIFQLTITLPVIRPQTFLPRLKELLGYNEMQIDNKQHVDIALKKMYQQEGDHGLMESLIDNIRDLKRFANHIKLNFEILKEQIVMGDFFLLSLLQISYINIYQMIRNRRFLILDGDSYKLDNVNWDEIEEIKNLKHEKEKVAIKTILETMFSKPVSQGGINDPNYFWVYFNFQNFNIITLKAFMEAVNGDLEKMTLAFRKWSINCFQEFVNNLDSFRPFKDKDETMKFAQVYLRINDEHHYFRSKGIELTLAEADKKNNLQKEEVNLLLTDKEITRKNRAMLAQRLLYGWTVGLFREEELAIIIYELFKQELSIREHPDDIFDFLLLNIYRIENGRGILYQPAIKAYKEKMNEDTSYLINFLHFFFRPKYQPPIDNQIVFNPFWRQLYPTNEELLKQLIPEYHKPFAKINTILLSGKNKQLVHLVEKYLPHLDAENTFIPDDADFHFLMAHMESTGQIPPGTKIP